MKYIIFIFVILSLLSCKEKNDSKGLFTDLNVIVKGEQEKNQLFQFNNQYRIALSKADTISANKIMKSITESQLRVKKAIEPKLNELIPKINYEQMSSKDIIVIEDIKPVNLSFSISVLNPDLNLFITYQKGKNFKDYSSIRAECIDSKNNVIKSDYIRISSDTIVLKLSYDKYFNRIQKILIY